MQVMWELFNLSNPLTPMLGQSVQTQAVQPNKTDRTLIQIPVESPKFPKIPNMSHFILVKFLVVKLKYKMMKKTSRIFLLNGMVQP